MSSVSIAWGLVRLALGLRAFLRDPVTPSAARAELERRVGRREASFLALVERAVGARPRSPYLALLRAAGCEPGDVVGLVAREGVEGALTALAVAGVYVAFEEFKGQAPARRGSQSFAFQPSDFDNPLLTPGFAFTSGGSSGRPSRIVVDLDYVAATAPHWAVWFDLHGWSAAPLVFVTPHYPGIVNRQLRCARFGKRFVKWFITGGEGTLLYRGVTRYVHAMARLTAGLPRPEQVSRGDLRPVASYLSGLAAAGTPPCVVTTPSTAVRICLEAAARALPLGGVAFALGGEPFTPARQRSIELAGARGVPGYGTSELAPIGLQCPRPHGPDDVHVLGDVAAVVSRPGPEAAGGAPQPFLVTGLVPSGPKLLLNVELGDRGVLESRACGCPLDELGYHHHLARIRSLHKLTGEGSTVLGADVARILEEELPRRFGGTALDYQLVETLDAQGLASYRLLVSPALGDLDEPAAVETLLGALARRAHPYPFMIAQWGGPGAIRVERRPPELTPRGKHLPFRTLGAVDRG